MKDQQKKFFYSFKDQQKTILLMIRSPQTHLVFTLHVYTDKAILSFDSLLQEHYFFDD